MYSHPVSLAVDYGKIFESSSRLLEFFALNIKSVYKNSDDNEATADFITSIKKVSTVLDIGQHSQDYLFTILKIAKRAGKLILFENDIDCYNYFLQKREVLKLKNVDIEELELIEVTEKALVEALPARKRGAKVIDFSTVLNRNAPNVLALGALDEYCLAYKIAPDFIKIDSLQNKLALFKAAIQILQTYRPKILIECEESREGRENIWQAFAFLTDLKYSGYFILDSMKIPIRNFDFNIYQNPFTNFYCKDFLFE